MAVDDTSQKHLRIQLLLMMITPVTTVAADERASFFHFPYLVVRLY